MMGKWLRWVLLASVVISAAALFSARQGWIHVPDVVRAFLAPGTLSAPVPAAMPIAAPAVGSELQPIPASVAQVAKGRSDSTATLLSDGTVLIVGGYGQDRSLPGIEIFNPSLGTTEIPGRLPFKASGASVTRLSDGRILIAGGDSAAESSRAALFDPATGRSSPTGSLVHGRTRHTATLLADGRVLIIGGEEPMMQDQQEGNDEANDEESAGVPGETTGEPVASAEVYDPASSKFSMVGMMHSARARHSASLLKDGRVLIAGGMNGQHHVLDSAELFDPSSSDFHVTGNMNGKHVRHSATLLPGGRVLIAGGVDGNGKPINTAEIYDSATGRFRPTGEMRVERAGHSAILLRDGTVLITGGLDEGGNAINTTEIYDLAKEGFRRADALNSPRAYPGTTLLPDGRVLITGGVGASLSAELYDPSTTKFSVATPLRAPRTGHFAIPLDSGRVLIAGGNDSGKGATGAFELYDPARQPDRPDQQPYPVPEFPLGVTGHTVTVLKDGRVLIAGGSHGYSTARSEALIFDPKTRMLSVTGSMHTGRIEASATVLADGRVLIVGGLGGEHSDSTLDSAEIYDPATGAFSITGKLNTIRTGHSATLLKDGRVLITGGYVRGTPPKGRGGSGPYIPGGASPTAELYDPSSGKFSVTGAPASTRNRSSAILLPNGRVLVAGGGPDQAKDRAELYDPASATFVDTGRMAYARHANTALLLADGRVLLVGPHLVGKNTVSSTELYDPLRGDFIADARIDGVGEASNALLLKDGRLLIIGNAGAVVADLAQMPVATPNAEPARSAMMMRAGTFRTTGTMLVARSQHTATLLKDGRVLLVGGIKVRPDIPPLSDAELYDAQSGTFTLTGSLSWDRFEHTATLLPDGRVLVAGGSANGAIHQSAELYDPGRGKFSSAGNMTVPRRGHSATLLPNGRVLLVGGASGSRGYSEVLTASAELYDPISSTYTPTGSLHEPRLWHMATLLPDGRVLIAGGTGSNYRATDSAEIYDPATGTFSPASKLAVARSGSAIVALPDGKVLLYAGRGGSNSGLIGNAELYDPNMGGSTPLNGSESCNHVTATMLQDGRVLFVSDSGCDGIGAALEAELFDPVTRKFTPTARLSQARFNFSATLLADGTVLIAGGEQGIAISNQSSLASAELFDPATGALIAYPPRNTTSPQRGK